MKTDDQKIVSVMSFNSLVEAQLYKALLESAGIQARMQNDIAAQIIPVMQVNLLVNERDQRKAREIMGAKFDIDEFIRQSGSSKKRKPSAVAAPRSKAVKEGDKSAGTSPSAKEKSALKVSSADRTTVNKQPARAKSTVSKTSPAPRAAASKATASKAATAKRATKGAGGEKS